jgi:protein SCO1/2
MRHFRAFRSTTGRRGHLVVLALSVLLALFIADVGRCEQLADPSPRRLIDEVGITPVLGEKLPLDLKFVDADGRTVRLGDLFGERPVVLHLVYYQCPMLCKLSSDGLLRTLPLLSLELGEDFSVITLSFDPREGPELAARARQVAAERCGSAAVEQGWRFLSGDAGAIDALCDAVGFRFKFDARTGQYAHAAGVFVLTSDGVLSRFISGIDFSSRDLRLALVEASAGKVGSAADQVMLMCYMYDPATGRYGFAIMSVLRVAGIGTVGAMALGIVILLRRERRSPAVAAVPSRSTPLPE